MTNDKTTAEKVAAKMAETERVLEKFMQRPETKLMLSLLPSTQATPELVPTLLRSCFEAGCVFGAKTVMDEVGKLVTVVLSDGPRGNQPPKGPLN